MDLIGVFVFTIVLHLLVNRIFGQPRGWWQRLVQLPLMCVAALFWHMLVILPPLCLIFVDVEYAKPGYDLGLELSLAGAAALGAALAFRHYYDKRW